MKFSRFVLIGGVCALMSNILVIGFAHFGANYLVATFLAFGPVLVVGYTLHTIFTFETRASASSFARYTLAILVNYPIWIAALYVFCDLLGAPLAIAAPVTTALLFLWNYLSAKWSLHAVAGAPPNGPAE